MSKTKIEWADKTWNPVTGCSKISDGCKNCYAERMSKRLAGRCGYPADNPFAVSFHPERLEDPFHWRKPSRIFVCSMGDLFHENVSDKQIDDIFSVMDFASQHEFMVLTKRPERMREYNLAQVHNVWLGVSAENQEQAEERIPLLLDTPAAKRFVSVEPMIGPIDFGKFALKGLDLVICGGESGPGARPMHPEWVCSLRDQCVDAGVPFFFKQWGEFDEHGNRVGKKAAGRLLDGREWNGEDE